MSAALIPIALWAGQEILKELGQRKADESQAAYLERQAAQQQRNAYLADFAAADALQRGEVKAFKVVLAGGRRMGLQKVAFAHAGVDVSSGTPAKAMAETEMVTALDAATERNNAYRESWGYKLQASNMRASAKELEAAAKELRTPNDLLAKAEVLAGSVGALSPWSSSTPIWGMY